MLSKLYHLWARMCALLTSPLLPLVGLCVVDGLLCDFLARGVWPFEAILILGCLGFSGAGSLTVATQLSGSLTARFIHTCSVYAVVLVAAMTVTLMAPVFTSLLPPNSKFLLGLYIFGLGLQLGLGAAPSLHPITNWAGMTGAVHVMLALMLVQGMRYEVVSNILGTLISVNPAALKAVALAVATGFGLTVTGVLMGYGLEGKVSLQPLKRCAALSLIANALFTYFELPVPTALPLWVVTVPLSPALVIMSPLAIGFASTVIPAMCALLKRACSPNPTKGVRHRH